MSVPVGQMMAVLKHVAVQRLRGNARYPLELLLRVITASLETMKIVRSLPPLGELEG